MQFQIILISALMAFIGGSNAITVCTGYDSNSGACTGTCEPFDIQTGQEINVPQTACIFNSDQDTGFDAEICSQSNLGGSCSFLSNRRRVDITGDFNWDAGEFTFSILRTRD